MERIDKVNEYVDTWLVGSVTYISNNRFYKFTVKRLGQVVKLGKSEELLSLAEVKVMGYAFGKSYLLVGWEGKESTLKMGLL